MMRMTPGARGHNFFYFFNSGFVRVVVTEVVKTHLRYTLIEEEPRLNSTSSYGLFTTVPIR